MLGVNLRLGYKGSLRGLDERSLYSLRRPVVYLIER